MGRGSAEDVIKGIIIKTGHKWHSRIQRREALQTKWIEKDEDQECVSVENLLLEFKTKRRLAALAGTMSLMNLFQAGVASTENQRQWKKTSPKYNMPCKKEYMQLKPLLTRLMKKSIEQVVISGWEVVTHLTLMPVFSKNSSLDCIEKNRSLTSRFSSKNVLQPQWRHCW